MITFEEIRVHLPNYLSPAETAELLREIDRQLPDVHPTRMYTTGLATEKVIFQGDGIADLLYVGLPDRRIDPFNCMVLSNTCDIDPLNESMDPPAICYAPS